MYGWLFISGNPALDLCNSLRGRRLTIAHETLSTCDELRGWCAAAGLTSPDSPALTVTSEDLHLAHELRAALYLLATERLESAPTPHQRTTSHTDRRAAVETINACAAAAPQPELALRGQQLAAERAAAHSARALLGHIATSFISIVANGQLESLKECTSPTCGLLFIDDSRGRRRRWCSMQRCGNRSKVQRFAARRASAAADDSCAGTDSTESAGIGD